VAFPSNFIEHLALHTGCGAVQAFTMNGDAMEERNGSFAGYM
jgi:hypothetical protein